MTRKTTPVKPPGKQMVQTAAKAMKTGKANPTEARKLGARIMAEHEETVPDRPKPRKR